MRDRKLVLSSSMKWRCVILAILLTFGLVVTQLVEVQFLEPGKQYDLATRVRRDLRETVNKLALRLTSEA